MIVKEAVNNCVFLFQGFINTIMVLRYENLLDLPLPPHHGPTDRTAHKFTSHFTANDRFVLCPVDL